MPAGASTQASSKGATTSAPSTSPVHQTAAAAAARPHRQSAAHRQRGHPHDRAHQRAGRRGDQHQRAHGAHRVQPRPAPGRAAEQGRGHHRFERVAGGDGGGCRERNRRAGVREERADGDARPGASTEDDQRGERQTGRGPDEGDARSDRRVAEPQPRGGVVDHGEGGDFEEVRRGARERCAGAQGRGYAAPRGRATGRGAGVGELGRTSADTKGGRKRPLREDGRTLPGDDRRLC